MIQKRYRPVLFIVAVALVAGAAAGDDYFEKKRDRTEISQDKRELTATDAAFARLSGTIDRWVQANLDGDDKKVRRYEEAIFHQVEADVLSSRRVVERYEAEVRGSAREYDRPHDSRVVRRDDRADLRDDIGDLRRARQLLKAKERLVSSLRRTIAFSNKYRLLGDYVEILRRELGMTRLELAEDVNELHQNRVEGRRE